ncbi:ARF7EP-C domain-containing protein [Aphelenchoides fujianensis]|nr:ARF7EP-C domain-containing protein [Aphelenchoides fujianensis]
MGSLRNGSETLKVALPALIYTVQNFLLYVLYQMKTLTTALFTVLMLKRKLSVWQWLALVVLAGGVGLVQWSADEGAKEAARTAKDLAAGLNATLNSTTAPADHAEAGGGARRPAGMGMFSIPASFVGALLTDGAAIREHGFYFGFDRIVWLTVVWYGIGGLSVAVTRTTSRRTSPPRSPSSSRPSAPVFIFNFQPNVLFVLGAALVILSIFLYSSAGMFVMKMRPASKV